MQPQNTNQSTVEVKSNTQKIDFNQRLGKPKRHHVLTAKTAFQRKHRDVWIEGQGRVIRILSDDTKGDRHQRFILRTSSGPSVLVAHNIDLAPRINTIKRGDQIIFRGEYVYNEKGGILHWTHHDPRGDIKGGWLKHRNKTYQ